MKKYFLTFVLAIVIPCILPHLGKNIMAQSIDSDKRKITVTGEGRINTVPDMATVRFGIVVRNEDPEEARRLNAEISRDAMNSIRELGIDNSKLNLQTLRLQPVREYDPETRRQVDKGFEATRELVVVIEDLDALPTVIAGIVQKGANRLNGITYSLKEKDNVRNQALVLAVSRAKEKALLMSEALDVEVGDVLVISEQSFSIPTPILNMESSPRVMMAKADAAPEPEAYAAGEIEVKAIVQVVFELR